MTTTDTSDRQTGLMERTAGRVAFAIAVIVTLQGVFILFYGFDQGRFERKADVEWAELEQAFPTRDRLPERWSGRPNPGHHGDRLRVAGLSVVLVRHPQRPARGTRSALGVPGDAHRWSIHFLVNDDTQIGTPNLVFTGLTAVAIFMARSELTD